MSGSDPPPKSDNQLVALRGQEPRQHLDRTLP